jgi:mRNA-decapping enzyme 1B
LYRNQRSAISGFWFYCEEDCVRIHALLEKLIKKAGIGGKTDPAVLQQHVQQQQQQQQHLQGQGVSHRVNGNVSAEKKPSDIDIFSMLSKAQAEFTHSGNGSGIEQQLSDMKIGQPARPPQNQPPPSMVNHHQPLMKQISTTMPDITSPNVVSFFAAAQQPNGVIPIIAENQHHGPPMIPKPFMNVAPVMVPHHPIVQPPVQTLDEIEKQHRVQSISPKVDAKLLNNLLNTSLQQQQQIIHPQPIQSSSPQPIKLLQQQQQQPGSSLSQPKLIAPTMFQASSLEDKLGVSQQPPRPEPLTHNQLIQAINYLLENDPEFIRKIHEAYIKSFNKIVSL